MTKKNIAHNDKNYHRYVEKENDISFEELFAKMICLRQSVNNICQESSVPLSEILKYSNSTLGKLYKLFLSVKDKKRSFIKFG